MRRFLMASALMGVMVILGFSAAQEPPDPKLMAVMKAAMPILANNPATMTLNPGVQKELKMSEDQVTAVREKVTGGFGFGGGFGKGKGGGGDPKEAFAKMMERYEPLKDVPEDKLEAKIREVFKEELEGPMKEVEKILKPEQLARLKQIARQQGGPGAYLKSENVADLKITDDQKTKLKEINDELQKDVGELRRAGGGGKGGGKGGFGGFGGPVSPETQQKIDSLTKEANEKAAEVLTPEQKTKYKELIGAPYTVQFQRRPKKDD
jgi:Spy/CpxP family protein refolding chaperone